MRARLKTVVEGLQRRDPKEGTVVARAHAHGHALGPTRSETWCNGQRSTNNRRRVPAILVLRAVAGKVKNVQSLRAAPRPSVGFVQLEARGSAWIPRAA